MFIRALGIMLQNIRDSSQKSFKRTLEAPQEQMIQPKEKIESEKKKHDCRILHAWKFQIKEEEEKQKSLSNIFDLSRDPKNRKEPYNSPAGNSSDVSPKDSIRVLKNPERVSKIV